MLPVRLQLAGNKGSTGLSITVIGGTFGYSTDYKVITKGTVLKVVKVKNHKLARAIANQSWRKIRRQLEYKCDWYGKQLVTVNPRKTSQICSSCVYDDGKHTLDIRPWTCPNCGIHHDRDINAANNILSA